MESQLDVCVQIWLPMNLTIWICPIPNATICSTLSLSEPHSPLARLLALDASEPEG